MKKGLIIFGAIIGSIIFTVSLLIFISFLPSEYSTTNIEDYGVYIKNGNNKIPRQFINSFFPEEIEDSFTDIDYSYKAENWNSDRYACEAYLEFVIEDEEYYQSFVKEHTKDIEGHPFEYDQRFTEYIIDDLLIVREPQIYEGIEKIWLFEAKFGKILCSDEDNRIIFVAIMNSRDGIANTKFLCKYFERFDIYPPDIATRIYPPRASRDN